MRTNGIDKDMFIYLIIAIVCGIVGILFSQNIFIMAVLTIVEAVAIVIYLICGKHDKALSLYVIFVSMSLEFEYTIGGDFYGLKGFRIFGITIAVWMMIPFLLLALKKWVFTKNRLTWNREAWNLTKEIITINVISIIVGCILLFLNDNEMLTKKGSIAAFLLQVYVVLTLITIPAFIFGCFISNVVVRQQLKKAMIAIMVAVIFQQCISIVTGTMGAVWGAPVTLASSVQLFCPFLILFLLYEDISHRRILALIGIIGGAITFKYAQGSTVYLVLFSIPIWMYFIARKKKNTNVKLFILIGLMIIIPLGILGINLASKGGKVAVQYKLDQALSFINVFHEDWLESLPTSARFRIEEVMAISAEYAKKPYFMIFGKGLMGSFKDVSGYYHRPEIFGGTSGFSEFEWRANSFFSVHETFTKMYLTAGLFGLIFLIKNACKGIKNAVISPFIPIGITWLFIFWGYSTTCTCFGMASLFIGYADIVDHSKESNDIGDILELENKTL